ncbi:hypothetical protein HK105_203086 [Polyrhizophydium stewartii]|uniref:BTB domain-containing protein n=1 Tax=Polyrhizophydium stewartii TaxID=2732419 RepID=A0ABR4ND64_9FUNG|nr:hypothetical protein HK105_007868 [Polyrhizophydium stewartii]
MLKELRASLVWVVPQYPRQTGKITSPVFGPPDCAWELSIFTEGSGATRNTHFALFLDVVLSESEAASAGRWSRPIEHFNLKVLRRGSSREALVAKERTPRGAQGFGAGFAHPHSWGWNAMMPVARLPEALGPDDSLVISAEVVWLQSAELAGLLGVANSHSALAHAHAIHAAHGPLPLAAGAAPRAPRGTEDDLLFSDWLADVEFVVRHRPPPPPSVSGSETHQHQHQHQHQHLQFQQQQQRQQQDCSPHDQQQPADDDSAAATAPAAEPAAVYGAPGAALVPPPSSGDLMSMSSSSSLSSSDSTPLAPADAVRDAGPDGDSDAASDADADAADDYAVVIPAHRAILASRSEYFATMFRSGFAEGRNTTTAQATRTAGSRGSPAAKPRADAPARTVLHVTDFSPAEVRNMLELIYCGRLASPPTTFEARAALVRIADYYQLPQVHAYAGTLIMDVDMTLETCLDVLELAHTYSSVSLHLKTASLAFIRENFTKIKDTEYFQAWVRATDQRTLIGELFMLL